MRLPPRADRRPETACTVHGDDYERTRASRSGGGGGVRDPRAENLAKILVGYSTKVKAGEVVSIDGEVGAEPLLRAVYEEVLKAGAHPILNVGLDGLAAIYYEHASDEQLEWVSPLMEWTVDNADVRIGIGASANTRELSAVAARAPDPPPDRDRPGAEPDDGAQRRRRVPLVLHAVPDQRLRLRGGDEPRRLRGLLLRRLPGRRRRPADRLEAGLGRVRAPRRLDRGPRGGARSPRRAPTSSSASPVAPSSPASATTTCPTASSSPARSRTRSRAR